MKKLLLILLLIVGCVFGEDELKDRRVISASISLTKNHSMSLKDSKNYEWCQEYGYNLNSFIDERTIEYIDFSILLINHKGYGGYFSYGQSQENYSASSEDEEYWIGGNVPENEAYDYVGQGWMYLINEFTLVDFKKIELGVTYQPINNLALLSGFLLTVVDYSNFGFINSKTYGGISAGILLIPYQTKQYSGLTFQLGFSHSFEFGGGFDLGIGYRI